MAKQTRRSCDVSEDSYTRVTACAQYLSVSRSSVLEAIIAHALDGATFDQTLDLEPTPDKLPLPLSDSGDVRGGGVCMF